MLVRDEWLARLRESTEAAARWITLVDVDGVGVDDPRARSARTDVLRDPGTTDLLDRLVPWDVENPISGHHAPTYAPHLLTLLFDIGVRPQDDPRIGACLDEMTRHVSPQGRFESLGTYRGTTTWSSLPCDHHAVLDVLVRAGRAADPVVTAGLDAMEAALGSTPAGLGWRCLPDPAVGFRGPGRKADACPQVGLQALRVYGRLPPDRHPPGLPAALRTPLEVWRRRATERPYQFGHGRSFKEGKWPAGWYSALEVADVLGRHPTLWSGPGAAPEDTAAMAEVTACVLAYVLDRDGRAVPRSVFTGWNAHSIGRRGHPSDLATALVVRALAPLEAIAPDVEAVDVLALTGSVGGAGTPRPPRT